MVLHLSGKIGRYPVGGLNMVVHSQPGFQSCIGTKGYGKGIITSLIKTRNLRETHGVCLLI